MAKSDKPDKAAEPSNLTRDEVNKLVQEGAAAAAKAAVEALMPAIASAVLQGNKPGPMVAGQVPRVPVIRCGTCGQDQRACKVNGHEKMVVYPARYPEFAEWFMGVYINGVRYLSDNASHLVTVPKDAVAGIKTHIQVWEDNERTTKLGKKRRHNTGSVDRPNTNVPYFR